MLVTGGLMSVKMLSTKYAIFRRAGVSCNQKLLKSHFLVKFLTVVDFCVVLGVLIFGRLL